MGMKELRSRELHWLAEKGPKGQRRHNDTLGKGNTKTMMTENLIVVEGSLWDEDC